MPVLEHNLSGSLSAPYHKRPLPASTRKSAPPEGRLRFSLLTLQPLDGGRDASPERVMQKQETQMTTEIQTPKELPAFYIFVRDTNGESRRVGTAWNRRQGRGIEIVIDNSHYVGFPPNKRPAPASENGA